MNKRALWVLPVFLVGVAVRGGDAPKDQEKLQGTWSVVSMEESGKKAGNDDLKGFAFQFAGNKLTVKVKDKAVAEFSFKLDAGKKPKTIHLTSLSGDDKGKVDPGIYEFTDDGVRLCVHEDGKEPPTAFASKVDSNLTLVVLKRPKK